jgi:hypothetical protein
MSTLLAAGPFSFSESPVSNICMALREHPHGRARKGTAEASTRRGTWHAAICLPSGMTLDRHAPQKCGHGCGLDKEKQGPKRVQADGKDK